MCLHVKLFVYILLCFTVLGICECLEEKWKLEARVGDILNILNVLWTFPRTVLPCTGFIVIIEYKLPWLY